MPTQRVTYSAHVHSVKTLVMKLFAALWTLTLRRGLEDVEEWAMMLRIASFILKLMLHKRPLLHFLMLLRLHLPLSHLVHLQETETRPLDRQPGKRMD